MCVCLYVVDTKKTAKKSPTSETTLRSLTKRQKAQLEAMKSFGGSSLDNVLLDSKRKVAKTLESAKPRKRGREVESDGAEVEEHYWL